MDYKKILFSEISFQPEKQHINNDSNYTSTSNCNNNNNKSNGDLCKNNKDDQQQQSHKDGQDFQVPKYKLSDPNLVKLNWLITEKVGGGLINVGNTCFLNSVIQCLTYCPPLYNFLVKCDGGHQRNCKLDGFCMLCEMEKLVRKIRNSTGTSIKPVSIVQRLKYINRTFQFGRQEDAHEFLRYLIDHMWKACLLNLNTNPKTDSRIKETTIINHIFGGYHRSQVHCLTCNSRSDTFDFFMEFILDIRNAKSLEDALRKFTQAERLENENAYKCSNCRKKVAAKKKFTVYKAPNVATFQLKRFDSDRIFGGKITKYITYPEELDLRPFMSDTTKPPIKYQLSAVLVHQGSSCNSGHYFCFIKNSNNFWYRMDDSNVTLVSNKTVLDQQAYVLFYTRKQMLNNPARDQNGRRKEKFSKSQYQKTNKNNYKYQHNNHNSSNSSNSSQYNNNNTNNVNNNSNHSNNHNSNHKNSNSVNFNNNNDNNTSNSSLNTTTSNYNNNNNNNNHSNGNNK